MHIVFSVSISKADVSDFFLNIIFKSLVVSCNIRIDRISAKVQSVRC